jgi:hypothetical protein
MLVVGGERPSGDLEERTRSTRLPEVYIFQEEGRP